MASMDKDVAFDTVSSIAVVVHFTKCNNDISKCINSIFSSSTNSSSIKIYLTYHVNEFNEAPAAVNQLSQEYPGGIICLPHSFGFHMPEVYNYVVSHTREDCIFFIDSDIEIITQGLFEAGVSALNNEIIGIIGFELLNLDGSVRYSSVNLNCNNDPCNHLFNCATSQDFSEKDLHEIVASSSALLGIKRNTFDAIGGLDEEFSTAYFDLDLCLKVRAKGMKIVLNKKYKSFYYQPKAKKYGDLVDEQKSVVNSNLSRDRLKLQDKYPEIFKSALINPFSCYSISSSTSRTINSSPLSLESYTKFQKVFFVSSTRQSNIGLDPSVIYRCLNPAKAINVSLQSTRCSVISQSKLIKSYKSFLKNENNRDDLSFCEFLSSSVVIFHRPVFSIELMQIVEQLKKNSCKVVADYDDYVFDLSDYLNTSAAQKVMKRKEDRMLQHGIARNYAALELFNEFIVSTESLKLNLAKTLTNSRRQNYEIHVIQNTPSSYWFSYAFDLFNCAHQEGARSINTSIMGYFGGTASHSKDFQLVHQWIDKILADNKDSKFIYCSVAFDQLFSHLHANQVYSFAPVTYNKLPAIYNLSWLNIAPLCSGPFNQSKSGLKYFESAMFGLPVCASYIPDIQERFDGLPLLYTLETLDSIYNALNSSRSLLQDFPAYLESWEYILTTLKSENQSIHQNLFKVLEIT